MLGIIIFLIICIVLVAAGSVVFPFIGGLIMDVYHGIVAVTHNLLAALYAVIPGHDFGIALILFTILVRILLWPLIKKQLHQTKLMRQIQPELKRVKKQANGNKQLEAQLMMELYREKGINPLGSIGVTLLQLPVLFALYSVIHQISTDPQNVVAKSWDWVRELGYMQQVTGDIGKFSEHLFGTISLTEHALKTGGGVYWPIMVLAILAAVAQYFQSKQLMPQDKDKKSLKQLFKEAGQGKQADQSDMTAAMNGTMVKIFPVMTFFIAISVPGAITLYLLVSSLVGIAQQSYVLGQDVEEMESLADKKAKKPKKKNVAAAREKAATEATVVTKSQKSKQKAKAKKTRERKE